MPLLFVALPLACLFALEGALRVMERAGLTAPPSASDVYPGDPEHYVKIAVFGESAAQGFGSPRCFADILRYQLATRHPRRKFFVKNYAGGGTPFHGYEAELLKRVFDRYDFIVIYAGLAEWTFYLDENLLFNPTAGKGLHSLPPLSERDNPLDAVAAGCRAWNLFARLRSWRADRFTPQHPLFTNNKYQVRLEEIQPEIFPASAKERVAEDFRRDMEEIADLATRRRKHVLAAGMILDEPWKPFFSTQRPGLSVGDQREFRRLLREGTDRLAAGDPGRALAALLRAGRIDPDVAILEHRIGEAYWKLSRPAQARKHYRRGLALDGMPFRFVSRLNESTEAAAARGGGYFHYIDSVSDLGLLLARGYGYHALLADMEHPNLLGHAFLAKEFLCALEALPPLGDGGPPRCPDWRHADMDDLEGATRRDMAVTAEEEVPLALLEASWHYRLRSMSVYPEEFLVRTEEYLRRFRDLSPKTAASSATFLLGEAELGAARGEDSRRILDLLNESLRLGPDYILSQWYSDVGNGKTLENLLDASGIGYDAASLSFHRKSEPRLPPTSM